MRQYHLTRNRYWRPTINIDKLWALVPAEEKEGLTESSEVVPVIDVLRHGYSKVLGNGVCVVSSPNLFFQLIRYPQSSQTPLHLKSTIRLEAC